jgi:hypothetical protein
MKIGAWGRENGYRVAPILHEAIRVAADNARRALGINSLRIDMCKLLECDLEVIGYHFHIAEDDDIKGEVARAEPANGRLTLTLAAYDGIRARDSKYELILPHEIGHIALNHASTFAYSNPNIVHGAMQDSEVQADHFSHEFAMPIYAIQRHCRSVDDIRSFFNVPKLDAEIRANTLRLEKFIDW